MELGNPLEDAPAEVAHGLKLGGLEECLLFEDGLVELGFCGETYATEVSDLGDYRTAERRRIALRARELGAGESGRLQEGGTREVASFVELGISEDGSLSELHVREVSRVGENGLLEGGLS